MRQTFRQLNPNGNPRHKIFSISAMLTPRDKIHELEKPEKPSMIQQNRKIHLDKIKHQISERIEQEYQAELKAINQKRHSQSIQKQRKVRNHRYAPEPLRRHRKSNFQQAKCLMRGSLLLPQQMSSCDIKAESKRILMGYSTSRPIQDKYSLPKMISRKIGQPKVNHQIFVWQGQLQPWNSDDHYLP